MATAETGWREVRREVVGEEPVINWQLSYDEAILIRELLWVTQLGLKGKGAVASALSESLNEIGLDPSTDEEWENELQDGKIIRSESLKTGVYWA